MWNVSCYKEFTYNLKIRSEVQLALYTGWKVTTVV